MPMSSEFTPESERQRIQHLVSDSFHTSDNPAEASHWARQGLWPEDLQLSLKATVWP